VVNKALADPEILFFMSDLEAVRVGYYNSTWSRSALTCWPLSALQGVATSSDELLIQQGKLMRHVAYLDYQAARLTTSGAHGELVYYPSSH
jgi:hypothetical protein